MKKIVYLVLFNVLFPTLIFSQSLTQTVRGKIVDSDNNLPLPGATVVILGTEPLIAVTTDVNGNFRFKNIPTGRISLQLSYIGYESKNISDIVVNTGKEVVLDELRMQESVVKVDEVVVKANKSKSEALNEMALLSSHTISFEETNRYAGGFNDASRMLTNFAGVNTHSGNNIIVRGNAPKYVQWRLEGVEITNPSHFDDQNSSSPGMCALNNNLLATSDFYTGAFSPEYGDVLSSVYDVKLRAGNNEKFESTFGFGLIGTDFTVEGPFKKGYAGSYVVNYRYSTASIISDLGIVDFGGVPKYQDATFKILLPTNKMGTFSLYGLWGLSSFLIEDIKRDFMTTPDDRGMRSDIVQDFDKHNFLFNSGINHTLPLNSNSYLKTNISYSANGGDAEVFESSIMKSTNNNGESLLDTINRTLNFDSRLKSSIYRGEIAYNNKINSKNKIQIGVNYSITSFNHNQSKLNDALTNRIPLMDFKGNIAIMRNFISWNYRLNKDITLVSGIHNMNVLYNHKSAIEPRIAIRWKINSTNSIHAGYGKHSAMERIHNYFTKLVLNDGTIVEPNKNLDLLKADHFVLGYEKQFTENLVAKIEAYYQNLYNLPVENNDTSYYATINEDVEYKYVPLVNKGIGKNFGVELTLERFFANNYYFMINASLFDSKYKSLEGVWRNTQYNGNYLLNILCGKEFSNLGRKKNQVLSVNTKLFLEGGRRIIPLLRDGQGNIAADPEHNVFWDYKKAYDKKLGKVFTATLSVSYKWNKPKTTHELYISIENITNNKSKLAEYYDASKPNSIGYKIQTSLFPNFMYRVYF